MPYAVLSLLLLTLFGLSLPGCGEQQTPTQQQTKAAPFIVAINAPLQYFAQRLLGDEVEIRMLAPGGTDPAQWQPNVDEVLQLQRAELVLLNGAGYSPWLSKVSISDRQLVNTSDSATGQWIELDKQVTHSHGPGGKHAHSGYAFTTWMDMSLARIQAEAVSTALSEHWPDQGETIADKLGTLQADIDALDAGYREQAKRLARRPLIFSHPVYQYFERRYGMSGQSLHWEPETMPSREQWQLLENITVADTLFIWEGEPSQEISNRLSEMGVSVVVVDPAANPTGRDWIIVQRENLTSLQQVAGK